MVLSLVTQMEDRKIIEKSSRDYYEYALIILTEHFIAVGIMLMVGMILSSLYRQLFF